jgi:peroxiredoxin
MAAAAAVAELGVMRAERTHALVARSRTTEARYNTGLHQTSTGVCPGKESRMAADVGAKAPDFTLMNQDREPVTLSEQLKKGPVVLAFMPAAFSGTCTTEMCTFRDSSSELEKLNAQVLGITVDTFFALGAWKKAEKLSETLLSDFNKDVTRSYGVLNPDMIGMKDIAKRATFVIDRNGVVRYKEVLEDARNEPDYGKVKSALATL